MEDTNVVSSSMSTGDVTSDVQSTSTEQTAEVSGGNSQVSEVTDTTQPTESAENAQARSIPYDRFSEVITERNQIKQELEQQRQLLEALRSNPAIASEFFKNAPQAQTPQVDPEAQQALQVLEQYGIAPKDKIKQEILSEMKQAQEMQKAQEGFISKVNELSTKFDGKDGSPKFDPMGVAQYMDKTGINDPEIAYYVMNKDAFIDAKVKQARSTSFTEKSGQPMQTAQADDSGALLDDFTNADSEESRTNAFKNLIMKRTGHVFNKIQAQQ